MIDRLSVLCFAGTYGLALAADLARYALRAPGLWRLATGLTLLGWVVQTAYLGNVAIQTRGVPISTVFQSLLVLAWILVAIDLYLLARSTRPAAVGLFLLPLVLSLLITAGLMPARTRADWTQLGGWKTAWGTVHGLMLLGGAVSTFVAFAAGLMYLAQARRIKLKKPPRKGFSLPSLEQSERWNRRGITLAFPLLTFGLLVGVALNLETQREGAIVLSWTDPKIISAAALWLLFAALVHARYKPEWRGPRVMVFTAVAFGFLVFALVGVDLLLPTAHGMGGRPAP
jgi:ABC-type transport system involved in cytochrome c biogenesis permease subunit